MKHKRLIAELRAAREAAGLSQRELSAKLRRSDSYISKFEAGERRLEVCEFLDVCAAIKVDARDLIGRVMHGK
jgi:transcriptional regulator with XRE-family HTH domain